MCPWWSPGGAFRSSIVDVATFHNPKQQWWQYSEPVVEDVSFFTDKNPFTPMAGTGPRVGSFLISLPCSSLTDDDVLEDVRVVVRCGCHSGTAVIKKQHESPEFWGALLGVHALAEPEPSSPGDKQPPGNTESGQAGS